MFEFRTFLLTLDSAPEPDPFVVAGKPRDYMVRHPTGHDAVLVIELADSSVDRDRLKRQIYARAGVNMSTRLVRAGQGLRPASSARAQAHKVICFLRASRKFSVENLPGGHFPPFESRILISAERAFLRIRR